MQRAFKRQFVAYWALLPEINPDTKDVVGGVGKSKRMNLRRCRADSSVGGSAFVF